MTVRNSKVWILAAIVFVALFLRVYRIADNPPALSWDEVSIGYNAYSIFKTGKDEHGVLFPLDTFVAYGDYKPPLSIYLTVPAVAIFGLNEFAVRVPSAVAGTLTVVFTYLIAGELLVSHKRRYAIAMVSAALLAVSPWHINLSRAGFEGNIAVLLIVAGAWLLLRARDNPRLQLVAWIPFVLSIYTFNSARYFAPFLSVTILYLGRKSYLRQRRWVIYGWIIAAILTIPILPHLLSPEARLRFAEVNIFTDVSIVETANERIAASGNAWWAKIIHNRRVGFFKSFMTHYLDHFQPWFLFIRGDGNPKFSIQDTGQLYIFEGIFLVVGIIALIHGLPAVGWFLLAWLLLSIIPAATARETPHALRIENSLPTWQIFIAFGAVHIMDKIKQLKIKRIMIGFVLLLYAGSIAYYLHNYYNHYPRMYSGEWQYGYKQAIAYAQSVSDEYETIVISDAIGRPYMYTLFYTLYDPEAFRRTKDSTFDAAGFYHVNGFDAYRFVRNGPEEYDSHTLYILTPQFVPGGANVREEIKLLNGEIALTAFDMK